MSASVRLSAPSSSMTRIGSDLLATDSIEHSGDVIDGERFLEIRVNPFPRQRPRNLVLAVRLRIARSTIPARTL